MTRPAIGKYVSFADLAEAERLGTDYRITVLERPRSNVLIVAPHGGTIEVGTSEIAQGIAGDEHNLFCFEGLKPRGPSRDLHITSHRFDHPECLALAARCDVVIGIHGCRGGDSCVYLGGLDTELTTLLTAHITESGIDVSAEGHQYPGVHPQNICNRGTRGRGAQLEMTYDLRTSNARDRIVQAVRTAISHYIERQSFI